MLRISKLTDYATVILAYLAKQPQAIQTTRVIATKTSLSVPTVSKLLKQLTRCGLLIAQRGSKGGYRLAKPAQQISIAQIIHALEGMIALTECSHHNNQCHVTQTCAVRHHWQRINHQIHATLMNISLAEMI
jgi:FeS assembly SUF system regulator